MAHHVRFRVITGYDGRLMLINLLLLMVIAFVPFPTAVLSESGNQTATIFYALTMTVAGLLSALMWWHAFRSKELCRQSTGSKDGASSCAALSSQPCLWFRSASPLSTTTSPSIPGC